MSSVPPEPHFSTPSPPPATAPAGRDARGAPPVVAGASPMMGKYAKAREAEELAAQEAAGSAAARLSPHSHSPALSRLTGHHWLEELALKLDAAEDGISTGSPLRYSAAAAASGTGSAGDDGSQVRHGAYLPASSGGGATSKPLSREELELLLSRSSASASVEEQREAASTVRAMSERVGSSATSSKEEGGTADYTEGEVLWLLSHGVARCLRLLLSCSDAAVREDAVVAVHNFAIRPRVAAALADEDLLLPVIQLLSEGEGEGEGSNNVSMRGNAAAALFKLMQSDARKHMAASAGAPALLLDMLRSVEQLRATLPFNGNGSRAAAGVGAGATATASSGASDGGSSDPLLPSPSPSSFQLLGHRDAARALVSLSLLPAVRAELAGPLGAVEVLVRLVRSGLEEGSNEVAALMASLTRLPEGVAALCSLGDTVQGGERATNAGQQPGNAGLAALLQLLREADPQCRGFAITALLNVAKASPGSAREMEEMGVLAAVQEQLVCLEAEGVAGGGTGSRQSKDLVKARQLMTLLCQ